MKRLPLTALSLLLATCSETVVAQFPSERFSIAWYNIGGGSSSVSERFTLESTLGQPGAGPVTNGSMTLASGYQAGAASTADLCPPGSIPAEFTIDPAVSMIAVAGNLAGYALQAQGPSSLAASVRGTIRAFTTSNSIGFPGGSTIDAQVTGNWRPLPGGNDGLAPADFGAVARGPFGLLTIYVAMRDLVLDVTGSCGPVSNGQFKASSLLFIPSTETPPNIDALTLASGAFPIPFTAAFASALANNATTPAATWQTNGLVEVLTLPIEANVPLSLASPNDSQLTFSGTIVARRNQLPPTLAIRLGASSGGSKRVVLSWPDPSPGYVLQETTSMSGSAGWVDVTQVAVVNGANKEVTLLVTGLSRVFRLRRP